MEDEKLIVTNTQDPLESPLDQLDDGEMAKPDPEEMLLLLTSSEPQQRMIAARAFCEIKDRRAIPDLIRLLKDSCPLVRVSVAYALGRNSNSQVVEAFITQLHQDWNGYVRKGGVWALGTCGDCRT